MAEINFLVLQSETTCLNQPGRFSSKKYITIGFILQEMGILLGRCL